MFRTATLALVCMSFFACNPRNEKEADGKKSDKSPTVVAQEADMFLNTFTEIDSSGILLFPLRIVKEKNKGIGSSIEYRDAPAFDYWNLVFHNTKTGEQYLLTDSKIRIDGYEMNYSGNSQPGVMVSKTPFIFYRAHTDDFNNDGELDNKDPVYLFLSDKTGKGFRQMSPKNCQLRSWQYIPGSRKIIMTVQQDSDSSKRFDEKDVIAVFQSGTDSIAPATPLFAPDFLHKLKTQYDRHWKK
jgi:hypothetical protein